ncbi:zinc finger CCCH domain-containing protein 38 [Mercurialis annua]|uniref:zinc finger CCCH domain-containing protein 38 n=1 Tax=Mercurialis annua TaxID=3986 RepID=UPI00215E31C8|nr:zinc finger CCCH domain-containing protein 38 [Mercurialis annua]XP_050231873.1 zinc finger CCCH domain-containing protein 38 [Mercurialis annua]
MRKGDPAYGTMSGSGRRRSSKWDLQEESRSPPDSVHEKGRSGKAGLPFRDKDLQRDWISPEGAGGNRAKWSDLEPLPGRRGSHRDDYINEDHRRSSKAMTSWEEEESYGTRMSPGLDDWRQQTHHNSPRNEWKRSRRSRSPSQSRSRSRSPDRGFGREPGLYERSRSRSGVPSQICKDFASGRCRRGNHCQFLHQGTQAYEDEWERHRKPATSKYPAAHDSREYPAGSGRPTDCCSDFLKGSCRRGASCRFPHDSASHTPTGRGSSIELTRERNNDRRHRDASPERHGDREIRRPAEIPCRFFAAGNCRNGKFCRFSHQAQSQAHASPERFRDSRFPHNDEMGKEWNAPKWNATSTSDAGKLDNDKIGTMGAPDQRGTSWSADDRWDRLVENKTLGESLIDHKMAVSEKKETSRCKTENATDSMLGSQQRADENLLVDMDMSPDWNYKVRPANHIDKKESASLISSDPDLIREASGQVHNNSAVIPSLINEIFAKPPDYSLRDFNTVAPRHDDKSPTGKTVNSNGGIFSNTMSAPSFNQSSLNLSVLPHSGVNMGGHTQVSILTSGERGIINPQCQTLLPEGKTINKLDVGEANAFQVNSGVPISQTMVSNEQLTQLTNISASLAQLLATGQQLPQLYAAHTSHPHNGTEMPSFANSEGLVKSDSVFDMQPNETVGKQKQYDPICDSVELEKHGVNNNNPTGLLPNLTVENNVADGKLKISSKSLSPPFVAAAPNHNLLCSLKEPSETANKLNEVESGAISKETKENNRVVTEESGKVEDRTGQENDNPENTDGDEKNDEGKKGKDAKGIRTFKFALVEFVKDLLKPAWKEGQMGKDVYKNIVKKVVDKVTSTMQGASIPQTQEKIQQYLSFSKPKLTKLVQAYVEKLQKDK